MRFSAALYVLLLLLAPAVARGQQVPDSTFRPSILSPAHAEGSGPVVAIDEAHHNFHTLEGRYCAFASLLARDGCRLRALAVPFTAAALESIDILVIANPLAAVNEQNWTLPTPSAFSPGEIAALRRWVEEGGALLLVVDHMPFPGAAGELASAFGARFRNGFAGRGAEELGPITFLITGADSTKGILLDCPVVRGRNPAEGIDSVMSFTGSAFQADSSWTGVLGLPQGTVSLEPDTAWQFRPETPRTDVGGWSQGAIRHWGRGRVAVFGEAAMFTAQLSGANAEPFGMSSPAARQNAPFLLNVVRWLSGMLEPEPRR